jgi:glycosyltransferase involved in cell wall biosynthesis
VGSVSDLVIHNETGVLCESTAVSVASAIISMKINDDRRIEMGKRAKQQAEQYFTLSKLVQSHEKLYESLSNGDQSN